MNIKERFQKERVVLPLMLKGYSRSMAVAWYRETSNDERNYDQKYGLDTIRAVHKRKYLCSSIERYDLLNDPEDKYITDFDYIRLAPYCNEFAKWVGDIITASRVLRNYREHFRLLYFSIIRRYMAPRILKIEGEDREYHVSDVISLLK